MLFGQPMTYAFVQGRRAVNFFTTATQNWCPDKLSVPTEAKQVVFALKLKRDNDFFHTVVTHYALFIRIQIIFGYQDFMIVSILN